MPMVAMMPRWSRRSRWKPPQAALTQIHCTATRNRPRWMKSQRACPTVSPFLTRSLKVQ